MDRPIDTVGACVDTPWSAREVQASMMFESFSGFNSTIYEWATGLGNWQPAQVCPWTRIGKIVGTEGEPAFEYAKREVRSSTRTLGTVRTIEPVWGTFMAEMGVPHCRGARFRAFPILDANGGSFGKHALEKDVRIEGFDWNAPGELSPTVGRRSLLKLPVPRAVDGSGALLRPPHPQERICLYDFMADADLPVYVFYPDKDWQPLRESYVLQRELPNRDWPYGPPRVVCVFATIKPEDLVRLIARMADVDPEPILRDATKMEIVRRARPADSH